MARIASVTRREGRMPLVEHLLEFRRRLVRSALAVVVGSVAGWFLSALVLAAMRAPISAIASQQHRLAELNYDSITGAFDLRLKIALTVGIVLASPVWLYQLWAFLVPALTRREVRYTAGFVGAAVPLFVAGCAAGGFVVPHMVQLLTSFAPTGDATLLQASDYFDFILKLVLAVGVAFVLPLAIVLLNFVGLVSGRAVLHGWRPAVLIITIFTALITPSADVLSMGLLAAPMLVLYFTAAAIAIGHDRRRARIDAALAAEYTLQS